MLTLNQENISLNYEGTFKRQTEMIDDLRKKVTRLERQNEMLENRVNDKDSEVAEYKRKADEAIYEMRKTVKENIKVSERSTQSEKKMESIVGKLKDFQSLLKNAETKIENQRRDANNDKKTIEDLKQINQELKNKLDGLMALRKMTEREAIASEDKISKQSKASEDLELKIEKVNKITQEKDEEIKKLKKTINTLIEELDHLSNQDEKARGMLDHKAMIERLRSEQNNARAEHESLLNKKPKSRD